MRRYIERAIHFDFHTLPDVPDLGQNFDAEKLADTLVESKVKYINFFARCNLGYSYYPTKIGVKHPYLGDLDMLGEVLKACHKRDIGVTAYLNGGLSHILGDMHKDWLTMREDGSVMVTPVGKDQHNFRNMCYDSPYGEHLLAEVKEILELYPEIDGIFVDCLTFPEVCFCPTCRENMKAEGIDLTSTRQLVQYNDRKIKRMAERLREVVPTDKNFFINGALNNGTCFRHRTSLDTHAEIECLVCDPKCGYELFPTRASYERNLFDNVVYMSGRFLNSWGDFGGIKDINSLEYEMFLGLLHCTELSVGDHLHPRGDMEPAVADMVGKIYGEIEKTEKWTKKAKYLPEIGIFHPLNFDIERPLADTPAHLNRTRLLNSLKGAARILGELKYQFDVIDDNMDLDRFDLLIVPDGMVFSENACKKVEAYLEKGGKIISSGQSALNPELTGFALPKYWNFDYFGEETHNVSFFKPTGTVSEGIVDMVSSIYTQGIYMGKREGSEELAEYIEPYFDIHFDGHQYYGYNPYNQKSDKYSACLKNGNVMHINFKIFEAYHDYGYQVYRQFIDNCIREFYHEKLMITNLPTYARASLAKCNEGILLQTVAYYIEHKEGRGILDEKIKLYGTHFEIRCDKPKKICAVPTGEKIPFEYKNGRAIFDVKEFDGHFMAVLQY